MQAAAEEKDAIFFLDTSEGNEKLFGNMEVSDLSGWLVPNEKVTDFQCVWVNHREDDNWIDYYCFAIPKVTGKRVEIEFSYN